MKRCIAIIFCFLMMLAIMPAQSANNSAKNGMTSTDNKKTVGETYLQSVDPQPKILKANITKITVAVGEKAQIDFSVYPENAASVYSYMSDNPHVARINRDGYVIGMSQGSTTITAKAQNGISCKIEVVVCPYSSIHEDVMVVAHRGASGNYPPGNSLEAFSHARELGADAVELDIQKSADGVILVRHDSTISYGGKRWAISELPYSIIASRDKQVCTLKEALNCIGKDGLIAEIELKVAGIERETVDIVKECGMDGKVIYASFNIAVIDEIKALQADAVTAYIMSSASVYKRVVKNPAAYSCDIVSADYKLLSTASVRELHLGGKQVSAWTVNTSGRIGTSIAVGVDAVITDYPQLV